MFYFFSKTVTYLLTPAGWLITAFILAFFTKNTRRRRQLAGLAFGIFWLFGNSFLMNELALGWEYPIQTIQTDSLARVAVLLTGGMINAVKEIPDNKQPHAERFLLGREADRAGQALYLYKTGAVRKILISGGSGSLPFQTKSLHDEGQMIAQFLRVAGVRLDDIVLENKSRNTHENAMFTARMLRQTFRTNRCVLITSAWHMRRAIGCFQKEGVSVSPFPATFLSGQRSFAPGEWVLPNETAFFNAYYLIRELIGYVTYRIVGYV